VLDCLCLSLKLLH